MTTEDNDFEIGKEYDVIVKDLGMENKIRVRENMIYLKRVPSFLIFYNPITKTEESIQTTTIIRLERNVKNVHPSDK